MCEVCGRVLGPDAAGVFGEGSIPDAEQAVLDLPVVPRQLQQSSFVHHVGWDRGDGIDDLPRAERPGLAQPFDADDPAGILPELIEPRRDGAHRDASGLDAAMAAIDLLGPSQIGRIKFLFWLARAAGEP